MQALRREGEERCAAIRLEAEAGELRLRASVAADTDGLQTEHARRRDSLCAGRRHDILMAAQREAGLVRLRTEDRLAKRLHERARASIGKLREERYESFFRELAAESMGIAWSEVRVNPADAELAARHFHPAVIATDPAITGGFEAATPGGEITWINTLERRLDRAWPDLLPRMVAELRGRPP